MKIRKPTNLVAVTAVLAATVLTATGCSSLANSAAPSDEASAKPLIPVTFQTFAGTMQTVPVKVAQEQGLFEENGLEVTVSDGANGPVMIAAVAAGQVDVVGLPMFLAMQSAVSGAKLKALVGLTGGGGSVVFVADRISETDAKYPKSAEVLQGKTAAIAAPGGYSDRLFQVYVEGAGVTMQYVTLPGVAPQVAAMNAGQVDVTNMDMATSYGLTEQGVGHILWDFQTTGPEDLQGATTTEAWVSDQFIAENPDAAEGFARAIAQADAWMNDPANRDEVAKYFSDLAGVDVADDGLDPMIEAIDPVVSADDVAVYNDFLDPGVELLKASALLSSIVPQDEAAAEKLAGPQ